MATLAFFFQHFQEKRIVGLFHLWFLRKRVLEILLDDEEDSDNVGTYELPKILKDLTLTD